MPKAGSGNLRRRLVAQISLMIVSLLLLAAAAMWGINSSSNDYGDALQGYQQLRGVYEIGFQIAIARQSINSDPAKSAASVEAALAKLEEFPPLSSQLKSELLNLKQQLAQNPSATSFDPLLGKLANISSDIRLSITSRQNAAEAKHEFTLIIIACFSAAVLITEIFLGLRQYRSIMQLVQAERLASVGFLAAGVAHEINNPLSIITGYGERTLQQLDGPLDSTSTEKTRKAIAVICEEAFRCKGITDRLLWLARPDNPTRSIVHLDKLANEVISSVGSLPEFRDRKIVLETANENELTVQARDGQMKQVILNLLLNALQAVKGGDGIVRIVIARKSDQVEMSVADNGRGMSAQTSERIFEPFYSIAGENDDRRGTGLGLSITRSIVADHGGTIAAESNGVGMGSKFTVRFPGAQHAAS